MGKMNLQQRIVSGRWTLSVCLVLATGCWMAGGRDGWRGFLLYALAGYLLMLLVNGQGLIRKNSHMPPVCYMLMMACYAPLQHFRTEQLSLLCWWLALYAVMQSYRKSYPMRGLFYAGLALGAGSLLLPQLVWFIPAWWVGAAWFRALTMRSCCASLVGLMLPYWLLFAYGWCTGSLELLHEQAGKLVAIEAWQMPGAGAWAMLAMLGTMLLVGTVHCKLSRHEEKQSTRAYLNFLALVGWLTTLVMLLQPSLIEALLPHAIFVTSILGGHFMALARGKSAQAFFFLLLAGYLLLLTLYIYTAWRV